jgi:prepilin-type N-terminal cleavage/methylation domain-containing protein
MLLLGIRRGLREASVRTGTEEDEPMNNTRGFTVIEVLFAAVIVAVALVGIAGLFPTAYRTVDWSGEETVAVTLAKQRLEWLRNQPFTAAPMDAGTTTETLAGDYTGYTRTTSIQDNTPIAGVKQVTVTVATPARRTAQILSLIAQ